MPIKAIIIDDEASAQRVLKNLLAYCEVPVEVVEVFSRVPIQPEHISSLNADVVFLDINMPILSGFDLFKIVKKPTFKTIFTTAFAEHALKAFKVQAFDYLLKPINRNSLNETLLRLQAQLEKENVNLQLSENKIYLTLNQSGITKKIDSANIICIKGEGSYSNIFLSNGQIILTSKLIKFYEEELSANSSFMRTQKSYLVNLNFVLGLQKSKKLALLNMNVTAKISSLKMTEFLDKTGLS